MYYYYFYHSCLILEWLVNKCWARERSGKTCVDSAKTRLFSYST